MSSGLPGEAQARAAREALADALEQGGPAGTGPEAFLAMRDALRDVAALAARWRAGINDVGPAAAAEVMDAIRGEIAQQQADRAAAARSGDDAPWHSEGWQPGG